MQSRQPLTSMSGRSTVGAAAAAVFISFVCTVVCTVAVACIVIRRRLLSSSPPPLCWSSWSSDVAFTVARSAVGNEELLLYAIVFVRGSLLPLAVSSRRSCVVGVVGGMVLGASDCCVVAACLSLSAVAVSRALVFFLPLLLVPLLLLLLLRLLLSLLSLLGLALLVLLVPTPLLVEVEAEVEAEAEAEYRGGLRAERLRNDLMMGPWWRGSG
mmetsp:Transcript_1118/g.1858  ORF Transcript_1118/g.1858 Transcript_1118/m.1858 type:complete len:213 (+) Transcript_1118:280-918(+)